MSYLSINSDKLIIFHLGQDHKEKKIKSTVKIRIKKEILNSSHHDNKYTTQHCTRNNCQSFSQFVNVAQDTLQEKEAKSILIIVINIITNQSRK